MPPFNNEYAVKIDEYGNSVEYPWDAPDADYGQWDTEEEEKEDDGTT